MLAWNITRHFLNFETLLKSGKSLNICGEEHVIGKKSLATDFLRHKNMFNRVELCLAFCLFTALFFVSLPILPLFFALLCSVLYVFVSRNASNLAYFRRVRFHAFGFDREAPVDPRKFLQRMTVLQFGLIALSLFFLSLYIVPIILLLSPRFSTPVTRVEVQSCNVTYSGMLQINGFYLLESNGTCASLPSNVYHCEVFSKLVEKEPCRLNFGPGLDVFILSSISLLDLITLLVDATNVVDIAKMQRIGALHS